jgi:integrase
MARVAGRFTKLGLDALLKKPGLHGDGGGLYLSVAAPPSRACSWVFRYMIAGKARTMGLGPYPEVTLAEARAVASEKRRMKAHGQDPLAVRDSEKVAQRVTTAKAMTFKQCAEEYISDHRAGWKNAKTGDQWASSLESYAYPFIGSLPVGEIDTALIMKVLKQDITKGKKVLGALWNVRTETASRVRGRIEVVLDWAETNGYRSPGKNPARWKGHLDNNLHPRSKVNPVKGHPALPVESAPEFMAELRDRSASAARALEFLILTAARRGEVEGATWGEIDLGKRIWSIPKERMKNARGHTVPLSTAALSILKTRTPGAENDLVFPGESADGGFSEGALERVIDRMNDRHDKPRWIDPKSGDRQITPHGFRATFRTWCADKGVSRDLAEACLSHATTSKAEAPYLRTDVLERRRPVMEAWAAHCAGQRSPNVSEQRLENAT